MTVWGTIKHFGKIGGYHGVNLIHGCPAVSIYSPSEVIRHEEKQDV